MAGTLDQFFRAGERVLHRVPEGRWVPNWRTRLTGMAAFGVSVLLLCWLALEPALATKLAVVWVILWAIVTPLLLSEYCLAETAVTDQRALSVEIVRMSDNRESPRNPPGSEQACEKMRFTEVKLDAVASMMVLGDTVAIAKIDGGGAFLKHPGHASNVAAAIAQATGLAPPRTPLKVRVASEVMGSAKAFSVAAAMAAGWHFVPDVDEPLRIVLGGLIGAAGTITAIISAELLVIVAIPRGDRDARVYTCGTDDTVYRQRPEQSRTFHANRLDFGRFALSSADRRPTRPGRARQPLGSLRCADPTRGRGRGI